MKVFYYILLALILISCGGTKHKTQTSLKEDIHLVQENTKKSIIDNVDLKTISIFTSLGKENIDSVVVLPEKIIYYGVKKEVKQSDSIASDYKGIMTENVDSSTSQYTSATEYKEKEKDKSYYNIGFFFIVFIFILFVLKRANLF